MIIQLHSKTRSRHCLSFHQFPGAIRWILTAMMFILLCPSHSYAGDVPRVVHYENFSNGAGDWTPTDTGAWKITEDGGDTVYSLVVKHSNYKPPHRSPLNIALLDEVSVGSFELTVRARSTSEPYNHQSLCLFFGYQDPAHFYYVHFGKKTDDHANQIFIVNDAPRIKISRTTTPGTPWDDQWHVLRVRRDADSGLIEVFYDDMQTPVMSAVDHNFTWGQVGVGSFDDPGNFDDVVLWGIPAKGDTP